MINDFSYLKMQYPELISLDQMYRICKIAKRSAKFLLDNGIIPYTDTGKKTHKYQIALLDVIMYLESRETLGSQIPRGAVSSRQPRVSYSAATFAAKTDEIRKYFEFLCEDFPDVVYADDVAEMTGLSERTIFKLLKSGVIGSLRVGNNFAIPKIYVYDFVSSKAYINTKSNSAGFIRILGGFERWLSVKS